MDFFDFLFPEQAQASHLRKIAARGNLASYAAANTAAHADEISALRTDIAFLTMVVTVILKRLAETKSLSLADVQDLLDEVDGLDGMADGGLNPGVLRGLLGVLKEDETARSEDEKVFDQIAQLHQRYRR